MLEKVKSQVFSLRWRRITTWLSNDETVPLLGVGGGGWIVSTGERREMVRLVSSAGKRGRDLVQQWKNQLLREAWIEFCFPQGLREMR